MKISQWALNHPVPVGVITAAGIFFGILALFSLNREFVPPVAPPSISVVTLWPGAAAENVERDLTAVLEDHLAGLSGLEELHSESREAASIIRIQFAEGRNAEAMIEQVRARIDEASRELPRDILGRPQVESWGSLSLPVFSFTVSGPFDSHELAEYTEDVVLREIYAVDGVGRATVLGERRRVLDVQLDSAALTGAGITPLEVLGALRKRNVSVPAGLVEWEGDEWALRVTGEFHDLSEITDLPVGFAGSEPIRLEQAASVEEVFEDVEERVRQDGEDAAAVQVTRRESANVLKISRELRRRLEALESGGVRFEILHDDAEIVRQSLFSVLGSTLTGVLMAAAVIWLFLRDWRCTAVIAASLPVSLVTAFAGMRLAGQSINVLTMAGITVSLGMVVDASIVVLENIQRRRSAGSDPRSAASEGAAGVSGAVTASVTTTLCVFIPMLFLGGITGIVLKDLSLSLVFALGASLLSALLIVPPLAGRNLGRMNYHVDGDSGPRFMIRLENGYRRGLQGCIRMSGTVIFAAGGILVISVLIADLMGVSFIPAADYSEVFVSMELPPGSTLEQGAAAADVAEEVIRREIPEIEEAVFYVGMEDELSGDARTRELIWAHILLKEQSFFDRGILGRISGGSSRRSFREVIQDLNRVLPPELPGVNTAVVNGGFDRMLSMAADGSGYRVELTSESWDDLRAAADRVEGILRDYSGVTAVQRDYSDERRFITARLLPDALARLGVSAQDAAAAARIAFKGVEVGNYRPPGGDDRSIRLTMDLKGASPDSRSANLLPLRGAGGTLVPFDSVSEIRDESGLSSIRRRDRKRTVTVSAFTEDENVRPLGRLLEDSIRNEPLPGGVQWRVQGVGGLIGDSAGRLVLALAAALFLVYAVMAIQFEALIQPLIIMASVPFCFIGVVGSLAIFGSTLSIVSFLGIAALGGIVVNNAIVQIHRINQLRREGMALEEAVVHGAVSRLRPILMTTLTTFFGVIPLAAAAGSGARIYAPLGQAVAGGLFTSTLVTLYLIPVLYRLVERRRENRGSFSPDTAVNGAA